MPQAARLPLPVAWMVIGLWAPYTLLNTIFPGPALTYALGLSIAVLALGLLWGAGITPRECFLRFALISWRGIALLAILSLFIPAVLLLGRGQPLRWLDDLVYAPASALAQELFFRSALLYALIRVCRGRDRSALLLQAGGFAIWHLRAFSVVPFLPAAGVLVVTFLAGGLWGIQVLRDRTILYAAIQHTLFLVIQ